MSKQIIAAGGLVTNLKDEILWIFRRGFWDLPKGKLDTGETIQTCAIREVSEETGLSEIYLHNMICFTNHTYFDNFLNEEVTKRTYWFHMSIKSIQVGIPQKSEDIEKLEWALIENAAPFLAKTYPNIQEVITKFSDQKDRIA